jgi:hypothetical protein
VRKKFNVEEPTLTFKVRDHDVVLTSEDTDAPINKTSWLVMNCRNFGSEAEAQLFAEKLKIASDFSSVAARIGIDSGLDRPSGGISDVIKERVRSETGYILRSSIHGVDVFPDEPQIRFFNVNAEATVLTNPDRFLAGLANFFVDPATVSQRAKDIIVLLNYALMRPDPIAQIVFATSAVEMLGQQEVWSPDQQRLLDELALAATSSTIGTSEERDEVATSIKRGLHKVGLRQGVLRLLDRHGLSGLRKSWDDLYGRRSTLVHGLAPRPGVDYSTLAFDTVNLCGRILLTVLTDELPAAVAHMDALYEIAARE